MPVSIHITSPDCSSSWITRDGEDGFAGDAVRPGRRPKRASPGKPGRRCSRLHRARRSPAGTRPTARSGCAPGLAIRRTTRIADSLIACAWRMHSSSSGVFVSLAGPMTAPASTRSRGAQRVPQRERRVVDRQPTGPELGHELGRAGGCLDLERAVQEFVGPFIRRTLGKVRVEVRPRRAPLEHGHRAPPRGAHVIGRRHAGTRRVRDVLLSAEHERVDARGSPSPR